MRRPLRTTLWSCGSGARSVLFHATRPLPLPGRHDHPPALGGVRSPKAGPRRAGLWGLQDTAVPSHRVQGRGEASLVVSQDEPRLLGRVAAPRPSPSGAWRVRNHWPGSGVDSRIAVAVPQVDVWQAGVDASRLHIQGCDHPGESRRRDSPGSRSGRAWSLPCSSSSRHRFARFSTALLAALFPTSGCFDHFSVM